MTTRLYLDSSRLAIPLNISPDTGWLNGNERLLFRRKTLTTVKDGALEENNTDPGAGGSKTQRMAGQYAIRLPEAVTIAGTLTLCAAARETADNANAVLQLRARVIAPDGATVLGVLYGGDTSLIPTGVSPAGGELVIAATQAGSAVRTLSATLTPLAAPAGAWVVVEVGTRQGYGGSISGRYGMMTMGNPPTVDHPAGPDAAPWVEFSTTLPGVAAAAPAAPAPALAEATTTALALTWPAVAGANGYEVALDGGAWSAVGNVTAHTFEGLAPATGHTLAVRALATTYRDRYVPIASSSSPEAIDASLSTEWRAGLGSPSGQVSFTLTDPAVITGYQLCGTTNIPEAPGSWTLEGSADGTAWQVLDTRSGTAMGVEAYAWRTFRLPAPAPALKFYRLNVTATGGGATAGFSAFQLVGTTTSAATSEAATLEATTATPPPSDPTFAGLRLEVGAAPLDVLGDTYSLSIRRGNASRGVTDALEAGTLIAVVKGPTANPLTVPSIRTGAPVRVLVGLEYGPGDVRWEPLFTGTLDRARLVYPTGPGKGDLEDYRVTLTATDVVPVLADTVAESAVGGSLAQRVAHVLDGTGLAYDVDDLDPDGPAPALPTSERTAAGQLALAVDTMHGLAYVDRAGTVRVVADSTRPRTPDAGAADHLATDDPESDASALHYYDLAPSLDTEALVNVLDVALLTEDGTVLSSHTDDASLALWGPHADKVTVNSGVPESHADLWLASRRDPALRPESIAINALARPAHLLACARLEPYTTLAVARAGVLPAPVLAYVRDLSHTITADKRDGVRWLVSAGLRPLETLATRWDDVPAGIRWDDLDPAMTWDTAVSWHPYL